AGEAWRDGAVTAARPERTAFHQLCALALALITLTLATPFAFKAFGDNGYIALMVPAGFIAWAATHVAERAGVVRSLWVIVVVAIGLRFAVLIVEPLLSSDIYRYIWDGRVQATGVNPYRYVPADPALAGLRDAAIYPNINRADSAVTIYPPVAQMFFFIVTRIGDHVTVMRLALLAREAFTPALILLFLQQFGPPGPRAPAFL